MKHLLCAIIWAVISSITAVDGSEHAEPLVSIATSKNGDPSASWAETTLSAMNLEQKISQLFCGSTYGTYAAEDDPEYVRILDLVERFQIGGLMLHQGTPFSQLHLLNALQQHSRIPLWISQDLEWGAGMRVKRSTVFPSMMALGATRDPALAHAMARVIASEVHSLGVHQAYAPVADVNNNPSNPIINVRSFGETPDLVSKFAVATMRGLQDGGVVATAKHFPGHGDTAVDSHLDLPVLSVDLDRLRRVELPPFQALIDAGVKSVMVGHLSIPALKGDAGLPATLSNRVISELLRQEMGFDGLVVTDAMSMKGLANRFGEGEACVRAIQAGCDVLLMCKDPLAARRAILQAVKSGTLPESRIDESVHRILKMKEAAGLHLKSVSDMAPITQCVAAQAHQVLSREIARRSITLLHNQGDLLPITQAPENILCLAMSDTDDPDVAQFFEQKLKDRISPTVFASRLLDLRSHASEVQNAAETAANFDLIVLPCFFKVRAGSNQMAFSPHQKILFERLVRGHVPVLMISFGSPYLTAGLNQPDVHLACFSDCEASQLAAIDAVFGFAPITGKSPVTIPGSATFGAGQETRQVRLRPGHPLEVGMAADLSKQVDDLILSAIEAHIFPGAAVAIGRAGVLVKNQGYGFLTYESDVPVTTDSQFDLASLTKVIATTTATMALIDQGKLNRDDRVPSVLPEFAQNGKQDVTVFHLLSHTSGLPAYHAFHTMGLTQRDQVIDAIMAEKLEHPPGSECVYSDLGMITLGLIVEKIVGTDLDTYLKNHFWNVLGMTRTGFRPVGKTEFDPRIVPTEVDDVFRHALIQGAVHDETAFILGGIAGHAGLFSTSTDLAQFADMMLRGGTSHGTQLIDTATIAEFTTRIFPTGTCTRALGWDTKTLDGYSSAGQFFGPRSFGHTGFTGTSIWMDPDQQLFVILLTNRVHPSRAETRHKEIRAQLADIAAQAITGPPKLDLSIYRQ